jgi:cytochrome P450
VLLLLSLPTKQTQFLNTSVKFLLGVDPTKSLAGAPHTSESFIAYFHDALFLTMYRLLLGPLFFLYPQNRYRKVLKANHDYIDYSINLALEDNAKRNGALNVGDQQDKQPSLLSGLSLQTDDRVFIRNQIIQGMMASQETTSALLGNACFLLSRSPKHWQQIRTAISHHDLSDFDFDTLLNLKVVQNILMETLRIYPIFHVMARIANHNTTLPVGSGPDHSEPIFIPKGTVVAMNYYALHRDPAVYGSDVETFRPERWETIHPTHWEFMGFGGGNRECLGQQKVLVEAAYVLVRLAKQFQGIESRDNKDWEGEVKLTCKSKNGCKVALFRDAANK